MNKALLLTILGATILGGAFFYSRKAVAGGSDFSPEFKQYDWSFANGYTNPNTSTGSQEMNNPLNIRYNKANDWLGQLGQKNGFCVFDTPENCYRAGAKILQSYARRGLDTVEEIVSTWAPSVENPTENYISFVVKQTGTPRNAKVTADLYPAFLIALTRFEIGGFPYDQKVVIAGVAKAG